MRSHDFLQRDSQENSARKDLTFIEKALFAARLEQGGYTRDIIMAALTVDKTALSRLISSAVKIPADLIESIGAAPAIGRDRWVELSTRLERRGALEAARAVVEKESFGSLTSDQRFERIFAAVAMSSPKKQELRPTALKADDGVRFGSAKNDDRTLMLSIDKKIAGDFATYLLDALPELYGAFKRGEGSLSLRAEKG